MTGQVGQGSRSPILFAAQSTAARSRQRLIRAAADWARAHLSPEGYDRLRVTYHGGHAWQRTARRVVARGRVRRANQVFDERYVSLSGRSTKPLVARPAHPFSFNAVEQLDRNLRVVCEAFDAARVDYALLDRRAARRRVVLVTEDQRRAALLALVDTAGGRPLFVVDVEQRPRREIRLVDAAEHPGAASAQVLAVYETVRAGDRLLAGRELACEVEFWPVSTTEDVSPDGCSLPAGTAHPPRRNRWTASLLPSQRKAREVKVEGMAFRTYPGLLERHIQDIAFPIDLVYTWVDGSDPHWQRRKSTAARTYVRPGHHPLAANSSRFHARDELRFSLRSVQMYADWYRHVFLVTDGQVPEWLDTTHPRLTVVDHKEIFPRDALPTFNSHAIESRLHHIPGLANHYLYLNDDVFFGRLVAPEVFFDANGQTRFFLSAAKLDLDQRRADDIPVTAAAKNHRVMLQRDFGVAITQKFQHVPHPQRRDVLLDIESRWPERVAATTRARFRSPDDVSVASALHHYVAYCTSRATAGQLQYDYVNVGDSLAWRRLDRLAARRDRDTFCLNDTDLDAATVGIDSKVRAFLAEYFPLPSEFEKPGVG